MKSFLKALFLFIFSALVFPSPAQAVCPVCTIAVGAGLGISRAIGIDDVLTSVWIGGLLLSISFWSIDWLKRKYASFSKFRYIDFVVIGFWYLLVLIPLAMTGIVGLAHNKLWGIDKIILGTAIGSLVFLLGVLADRKVRQIKEGQLFAFQKVVFPVISLVIATFVLYFLTK